MGRPLRRQPEQRGKAIDAKNDELSQIQKIYLRIGLTIQKTEKQKRNKKLE